MSADTVAKVWPETWPEVWREREKLRSDKANLLARIAELEADNNRLKVSWAEMHTVFAQKVERVAALERALDWSNSRLEWSLQFITEKPFKPWKDASEWITTAEESIQQSRKALPQTGETK